MKRTGRILVAGGVIILLELAAAHASAGSVSQPNQLTYELCDPEGNAGLKNLITNQPNELLFVLQLNGSENNEVFSTKRTRVAFGVVTTGFRVPDPGSAATPSPEPATMLLLGSGLTGLAWVIRRKRRLASKNI